MLKYKGQVLGIPVITDDRLGDDDIRLEVMTPAGYDQAMRSVLPEAVVGLYFALSQREECDVCAGHGFIIDGDDYIEPCPCSLHAVEVLRDWEQVYLWCLVREAGRSEEG